MSSKRSIKVGIIGGSGLDNPDILDDRVEKYVDTPFGQPSDALILGKIKGVDCILLARHGRNHTINPTNVNYRANVWALKQEGCTHIIVTTASGSLREDYTPGDIVFLDQYIDRTTQRKSTFYDGTPSSPVDGVLHIPMHTPFCPHTRKLLIDVAEELGIPHHTTGTNITIEGPRFSSKAESHMYRSWGAHVINMSTVPEVCLAKEAGLCYASMALVTDYDSWRLHTDDHVSVESVLKTFKENGEKAKRIILTVIPRIVETKEFDWDAILTENEALVRDGNMSTHH